MHIAVPYTLFFITVSYPIMSKQEKERKGGFESYGFKGAWTVDYFIKLDGKTLGLLCSIKRI